MTNVQLPEPIQVAMCIYPGVTLLDFVGPLTALSPAANVTLVAKTTNAVPSDLSNLAVVPTATMDSFDASIDVLLVPGGMGTADALEDDATLRFLARVGKNAKFVTSVCSGSLLLAGAGLLDGYRATTHWVAYDALAAFGVEVVRGKRVVIDRNRITGGGVTAGIDFGLVLLAQLRGEPLARLSQLAMEYDPQPPFDSGTPEKAGPEVTAMVRGTMAEVDARCRRIAERLRAPALRNREQSGVVARDG